MNIFEGIFWMLGGVFFPLMCIAFWFASEADHQTSFGYRPDTPDEAEITKGCGWILFGLSLIIGVVMFSHGFGLVFGLKIYLSILAIGLSVLGFRFQLKRRSKSSQETREKTKAKKGFLRLFDGQLAEIIEADAEETAQKPKRKRGE